MLQKKYQKLDSLNKILFVISLISIFVYVILYFIDNLYAVISKDIIIKTDFFSRYSSITAYVIIISSVYLKIKNMVSLTFTGKVLFVFSLFMLLITLFNEDNINISYYFSQYRIMALWIYIYLFFYILFLKYDLTKNYKKIIIIISLLLFGLFLYNYLMLNFLNISWAYIESYFLIMMIPFIILLPKSWRNIFIIIILIAVLLSAKRTGFFSFIISVLSYFILSSRGVLKKSFMMFVLVIMSFLLLFAANYFFEEQTSIMTERLKMISDDGGSGRDVVFETVFDEILKSNNEELLFGHGYNKVSLNNIYSGYSSHNDFLEVTYDYGLFGLILYIFFIISILSKLYTINNTNFRIALFISFILFIQISLTSHLILYTNSIICLCAFWGYIDAKLKLKSI